MAERVESRLLAELQGLTEGTAEEASGLFAAMCSFLTPQQVCTLAEFLQSDESRSLAELEQVPARFAAQIRAQATAEAARAPGGDEGGEATTRQRPSETPAPAASLKTLPSSVKTLPSSIKTMSTLPTLPTLEKANCSAEKMLAVLRSICRVCEQTA